MESRTLWLFTVLEQRGDRLPMVALQPSDEAVYQGVRARLARVGFARLSKAEWMRGSWPWSPSTAVDVAQGRLVRFTDGDSSFYNANAPQVQPSWIAAGEARGRALVVLLPAGWVEPDLKLEDLKDRAELAAASRRLWAATGRFRVDQVKLRGPGWRK